MDKTISNIPSNELSSDDIAALYNEQNIQSLSEEYLDWDYTLDEDNKIITLNYYMGNKSYVVVRKSYDIDNITYKTKISSNPYSGSGTAYMFNGYAIKSISKIRIITFEEGIDTSECTDMSYMFYDLNVLDTINGLEYFDTSNVNNFTAMFSNCYSLKNININNWNTSLVEDMTSMFRSIYKMKRLDLSGWDTSNVRAMGAMFYCALTDSSENPYQYIPELTEIIGIENFDMSNALNLPLMVYGCKSLESINLTGWDISTVVDMHSMFEECSNLNEIIVTTDKWNIKESCNIIDMFKNCKTYNIIYV